MKPTNQTRITPRCLPGNHGAGDDGPTVLRPQDPSGPARRRGFTMIEMIGVLAILAILASMVAQPVISNLTQAAVTAEYGNLATLNTALVTGVEHNFTIPGGATWVTNLSSWLMMAPINVATNANGYPRAYVYDLAGFGSIASLPYTQQNGLANFPTNARVVIVSAMDAYLPPQLTNGPLDTANFNAIWNTSPGSLPNAPIWSGTNYSGKGANLVIQSVNLQPLFKQVILSAVDTNDFGGFSVQSGSVANTVPSVSTLPASTAANFVPLFSAVNAWYMIGTVINLYDTNNPATTLNLETQYVVQQDISSVFEDGAWRGLLTGCGTNGPASFFVNVGYTNSTGGTNVVSTTTITSTTEDCYRHCCHWFCCCGHNWRDHWDWRDQWDYWDGLGHRDRSDDCGDSCQAHCDSFMEDFNHCCEQNVWSGDTFTQVTVDVTNICTTVINMCQ